MRWIVMARLTAALGLLAPSACFAQEPQVVQESQSQQELRQQGQDLRAPDPHEQQTPQQPQAPASAPDSTAGQAQELIVPAGTHVPLSLTSPIHTGHAKRGDLVRLSTAFPVTINTQLAIPTGTYVEGVIDRISKHASLPSAAIQMHFTRIVFADGYNVPLDAAILQTDAATPDRDSNVAPAETSGLSRDTDPAASLMLVSATPADMGFAQFPTNPPNPTLPPLPKNGSNMGALIAGGFAGMAALAVVGIVLARHHADMLFDVGTQFEMVLRTDLVLDAQSVATAIAATQAH
jgi:hypothetical protein